MKKRTGMVIGIMAVTFALTLSAWQVSAETDANPDGVVAKVNGTAITQAELNRSLNALRQRAASSGKPLGKDQLARLKSQTLERLIGAELLYQQSKKEGIKVDNEQVDKKFAQWKKRFPNDAEYKKVLDTLHVTPADIKNEIRRGLYIEKFIDKEFKEKTKIPDKEIKAFYDGHPDFFKQPEQVRARHILIKVGPNADKSEKEAALKKIKDIQKKQEEGKDFAELAKEYSEGPSAAKGGDLGYFRREQMVKPFSDAAFALEPGQVSDVVKTRFGYHLIKVEDKKAASTAPYESVKEKLAQYLKQQKMEKEIGAYVEKLKKKSKIELFSGAGS
jgi:peptidyl-prolyl cis-trans isomerase C